jgi:two-component system, LytTR family, response regulator LytT
MRLVIIEDEKLAVKDLIKTLKLVEPDIDIVAILRSVDEAMDFFKMQPSIDLIFSDIELGDGLSFEIFEKFRITTPIVFCTAFNQYALDAFKTTGIDYVLKPFNRNAIENTLTKFHAFKENFAAPKDDYADLLSVLKQKITPTNPSVLIHQGDKIIPLNGKNIALFFIEDDYTFAYTLEGKKHLLSQNMDSLESTFSPDFFRANRQYLVNRKVVKDASHSFNRKLAIHLTIPFKEQILVGKLKVAAFTAWLTSN